jgi:hypothetical protein
MFLFLVANIVGSTIQIVALPLPLLSTLQASGLVFNSILATMLLKEPWTRRTGYGTVLVAGGAVLVSYYSALPEPSHNLEQLLVLLGRTSFLLWFILSMVFVGAVLVMTFCLRFCVPGHKRESPRVLLINGMAFGLVSGILSAHALLLAKSAVELVVRSISHRENQFRTFQPWLLVLAFLFLSLSQLYYLHLGLKLISTSVLYPFVFCIYNIVAILDGLIYFKQMHRLSPSHAGLIALGTVLLLAGVLALSWRLQDDNDDEDHHLIKAEIPQTLIAPGMGFVGDPDTESSDSASLQNEDVDSDRNDNDDDDDDDDERTGLITRTLPKTRRNYAPRQSHGQMNKRRHRASTLREFKAIWDAIAEPDDGGTYDRPSSSVTAPPNSTSNGKRRCVSAGKIAIPGGGDMSVDVENRPSLSRASTMPVRHARGRRKSSQNRGSALFSDLFKSDWWHFRRKDADDDDDHTPTTPRSTRHGV